MLAAIIMALSFLFFVASSMASSYKKFKIVKDYLSGESSTDDFNYIQRDLYTDKPKERVPLKERRAKSQRKLTLTAEFYTWPCRYLWLPPYY